jgi:WXXGXW repeat (2 copies)
MKRYLAGLVLAGALCAGAASAAEVVVRIAPPPPVHVGVIGVAPGPGYIWTPGYHEWVGSRYMWHEGVWALPPRPHAHWVEHRWEHRNGGYVFVRGHWR